MRQQGKDGGMSRRQNIESWGDNDRFLTKAEDCTDDDA